MEIRSQFFRLFHVTENLTKSCDLNHARVVLQVKKQVGLKRDFQKF